MSARSSFAAAAALCAGAVALSCVGCGEERESSGTGADALAVDPAMGGKQHERPSAPRQPELTVPDCPSSVLDCARASGTILYVERVDPDGDGDAHFVLASASSVTAPGITVVDVRADLRPHPLPGPGERLAAAGPVRTGSFEQRQIEALAIETGRAGG